MSRYARSALAVSTFAAMAITCALVFDEGLGAQNEGELPPGAVLAIATAVVPDGFLVADGRDVSGTQYTRLCKALGDVYNSSSDRVGVCRLPNLTGRVIVSSGTYTDDVAGVVDRKIGNKFGAAMHTLAPSETPIAAHRHTSAAAFHPAGGDLAGGRVDPADVGTTQINSGCCLGANWDAKGTYSGPAEAAASPVAHNISQPSLVLTYVIKY